MCITGMNIDFYYSSCTLVLFKWLPFYLSLIVAIRNTVHGQIKGQCMQGNVSYIALACYQGKIQILPGKESNIRIIMVIYILHRKVASCYLLIHPLIHATFYLQVNTVETSILYICSRSCDFYLWHCTFILLNYVIKSLNNLKFCYNHHFVFTNNYAYMCIATQVHN